MWANCFKRECGWSSTHASLHMAQRCQHLLSHLLNRQSLLQRVRCSPCSPSSLGQTDYLPPAPHTPWAIRDPTGPPHGPVQWSHGACNFASLGHKLPGHFGTAWFASGPWLKARPCLENAGSFAEVEQAQFVSGGMRWYSICACGGMASCLKA